MASAAPAPRRWAALLPALPAISRPEITFSLTSFVAAMLALGVSFALGLERPYWAMLTVYITSQPLAAAALSKGLYRLGGTLIGAAFTVLVVPVFVEAPLALSGVMALWVGVCLYISQLDRTPRSYLFMLAGYTAALIGFPAVDHPETIFDIAVLRGQEIGIGVVCSSLAHTLVPALDYQGAIEARIARMRTDMRQWLGQVFDISQQESAGAHRLPHQLAAQLTDLRLLGTHLSFHPDGGQLGRAAVMALWDRLVLLLPLIDAIEDRITLLCRLGALPAPARAALAEMQLWVAQPATNEAAQQRAHAALGRWQATLGAESWPRLVEANLHARLVELVGALAGTAALARSLRAPAQPALRPPAPPRERRLWHSDKGLALRSALAAGLGVMGCCVVWIATGWRDGGIMAMICAVVCCFFAALDDPRPAQRVWLVWTALSLPLAALYLFAILPKIHTFEELVIVLAPALVPLGCLLAVPAFYARMMTLMVGFCGALALTETYEADFASFLNSNLAQLCGGAAAILTTGLVRVIGTDAAINRILRRNWADLAALASGRRPFTREGWNSLMVDRTALLSPRLAALASTSAYPAGSGPNPVTDSLREVRIGLNLIQLREMAAELGPEAGADIARLQEATAALCAAQARARPRGLAHRRAETLAALRGLAARCRRPDATPGERALLAMLVGMTRALLPGNSLH